MWNYFTTSVSSCGPVLIVLTSFFILSNWYHYQIEYSLKIIVLIGIKLCFIAKLPVITSQKTVTSQSPLWESQLPLFTFLKHFQFTEEDIHLNSRTFLWPKDMEAVLELSQARLSHRRDMVEGVLRSKRSDFDAKWVIITVIAYIKHILQ
jgi:hypothetical protein